MTRDPRVDPQPGDVESVSPCEWNPAEGCRHADCGGCSRPIDNAFPGENDAIEAWAAASVREDGELPCNDGTCPGFASLVHVAPTPESSR